MRLSYLFAALAILISPALPAAAQTPQPAQVPRGDINPMAIAIPAFGGPHGAQIAQVISANLQRSGLFRPLDPASFLERDLSAAIQPRFDSWKQINAQALVNGTASIQGGQLRVDFRLWDVYRGEQMIGLQLTGSPENWRRVAHKISDYVYE
jgi:TolB protein